MVRSWVGEMNGEMVRGLFREKKWRMKGATRGRQSKQWLKGTTEDGGDNGGVTRTEDGGDNRAVKRGHGR